MNQDDVILLGELFNELLESYTFDNKYNDLVKKVKLIAQQAKASKDYQLLMDALNDQLSEIGKDDKDAKKKEN